MKRQGLLFGPFSQMLPNYRLVDVAGKPTTKVDFTVPVEGLVELVPVCWTGWQRS
jgi:putative thiamine transport system substrate-binding protein